MKEQLLDACEQAFARHKVKQVIMRAYDSSQGPTADDPEDSTIIVLPQEDFSRGITETILTSRGRSEGVALTSIVDIGGSYQYLFLLDCALPVYHDDEEKNLLETLRNMRNRFLAFNNDKCVLLKGPVSYHLICFKPLTWVQWLEHMAEAVCLRLPSGECVADYRYVGHSIERGYGSLRLGAGGTEMPRLVAYL